MSTVWRAVDAALRRSRVHGQFAGAAYGVRDWLSDLHAGRPLLATIDAIADAPDIRALLDPLHDSALARLTQAPRAAGDAEELDAEPHAPTTCQTPRSLRRVSTATRFAGGGRETPLPAVRTASAPAGSANAPARVAALLARHEHVRRSVDGDAVQHARWTDARIERRIVPFAGRRGGAGELAQRLQGAASLQSPTRTLTRWSEVAAAAPAQRLEALTGHALAAYERTPLAFLHAGSPSIGAARELLERGAMQVEPALPSEAIVRLADLAAPSLSQDTRRADAPALAKPSSDATSASVPPAAGEGVLGRMAGAISRIEERLAASTPSADPPTQWLAEDETLAERIHDILRRQALRHGIDAP